MIAPTPREPPDVYRHRPLEVAARVPTAPTPGRSIVTRRALVDIVRTATLGSYGVTGFSGGIVERLLLRLGFAQPGIHVRFGRAAVAGLDARTSVPLTIELGLTVAYGVPVAEVARQVDSAVRYALRRALNREVDKLTIHVDGLRYEAGVLPAPAPSSDPDAVRRDDLAASGSDIA
jgi:uncharacterized alkaline shock family protein YloU